jgi:hypothetical protein
MLATTTHPALLGTMAKGPAGEAMTLRKVQVGVGGGKVQEAIKHLTGDNELVSRAEEARLLEKGDSVILMRGHDWR